MQYFRVLLTALFLLVGNAYSAQDFAAGKFIYQGNVSAIAYDSSGNKYIVSQYHTNLDFNPTPGVIDEFTSAPQQGALTKINADGTYAWTRTTGAGIINGIVISGTTVYVAGYFSGNNVSVGGVGTVTSGTSEDLFMLALKTADGSPETAFSTDGVVTFDSGGQDFSGAVNVRCNCMAIGGGTVYMVGSSNSDGVIVFGADATTGSTAGPFGSGPAFLTTNDDARGIAVANGNVYVTGRRQTGPANFDAYVLSLSAATAATSPAFGPGGFVFFGGPSEDIGESITVSGTTVYVSGEFQSTMLGGGAGFGGSGTLTTPNNFMDGFVLALDGTSGAPVATFNGVAAGIATLTSTAVDTVRTVVVSGTTLFVTGTVSGTSFGVNALGTVTGTGVGDAFLVAIDTATGKALTSFSGDGIYTFGAAFVENGIGLALAPSGSVITMSGNSNGTDIGGPVNLTGFPDGIGFAVDVNMTTGSVDWVVSTTSGSGVGSLPVACALARNGSKITFDANTFDLRNSDAATVISLTAGLRLFDDNITIDGSDRRVTLNGSAATSQSGFTISTSGCRISGVTILAFPRHGIQLTNGAKNNVIGGNRGQGMGPNGSGMRLSSNGIAGINITGSTTTNNLIKGCWIGLDAGGIEPKPNLAGILIESGAQGNIIGGPDAGDENVISGNEFEGVTVSGSGSDGNIVVGNRVGIAGVQRPVPTGRSLEAGSREESDGGLSRSALGNGSAGVFLSLGTNTSKVGGTGKGEGNTIANNGGNGVEVRALQSRRNSARSNRITRNVRGGISLFDGANDGVAAPKIVTVKRATSSTSSSGSRTLGRTSISGTSGDGTVELYNDTGSQGATLIGTTTASGGSFTVEVDADDTQNITATLTDASGNTSSFTVFSALAGTDTDSDGVSDVLETIAGTDPNSSSSTPTEQGTTLISKGSVTAKFNATGKDQVSCTLSIALPDGFVLANSKVGVYFAGVGTTVTLDAKGKAVKGTASLKIKQASTTTLTFSVRNQDLRTALETAGFTNTTTEKTGTSVVVSLGVGLNDGSKAYVYEGTATMTYKATQDKQGKASLAK